MPTSPVLALHRRNRIDQLDAVPTGSWVEIDLDLYENEVYLTHDPTGSNPRDLSPPVDRLEAYLASALEKGVAGFILDCKRENVEKFVQPILGRHHITNYFYLNEMEIQADIFLEKNDAHHNGIRIWKYRSAEDVIRYAHDMKSGGFAAPTWSWIDCWQHGLLQNINNAYLPINKSQAAALQDANVKLCICSPELYVHQYGKNYSIKELVILENGVRAYRKKLEAQAIQPDMICTKFAGWWGI